MVGAADGTSVGALLGVQLGALLGVPVLGTPDGTPVGAEDGATDGAVDGIVVGAAVGPAVGHSSTRFDSPANKKPDENKFQLEPLPQLIVKLLVGLPNSNVTAADFCSSFIVVGFAGLFCEPGQLDPGHTPDGYVQVDAFSQASNVLLFTTTTLLSSLRIVYDVKPSILMRSFPSPSKSNTVNTNFGSVTEAPVLLSSNANRRSTVLQA